MEVFNIVLDSEGFVVCIYICFSLCIIVWFWEIIDAENWVDKIVVLEIKKEDFGNSNNEVLEGSFIDEFKVNIVDIEEL